MDERELRKVLESYENVKWIMDKVAEDMTSEQALDYWRSIKSHADESIGIEISTTDEYVVEQIGGLDDLYVQVIDLMWEEAQREIHDPVEIYDFLIEELEAGKKSYLDTMDEMD